MKRPLRESLNAVLIVLGILSAGMGLKGFLLSSHFIDGGVTGISMLLADLLRLKLPLLILAINLPFIALGYRQIGRAFAIRSAAAIVGLAACLEWVPFPDITEDLLLTAVFGGFFIGAGIGLAMRGGAVLDGTDVAALLISKRSHLFRVGDIILGMNVVIFLTAAARLGTNPALYSILTYMAASKTLDFILHGLEEYTAITIISAESEAIRLAINGGLGRGVTIFKKGRGRAGREADRGDPCLRRDPPGDRQGPGDRRGPPRPLGLRRRLPAGRRQGGRPQADVAPLARTGDAGGPPSVRIRCASFPINDEQFQQRAGRGPEEGPRRP